MNAIILAAGQGTRLMPMTNDKPKCLVKLFGKSILERQIDVLQNCGISDITVVTGYKSESINISKIKKIHNNDFKTTNMLESFSCAFKKLSDSTIVSYGDIIFEKKILEKLIQSKDDISVVVDQNWEKYWKIRFDNPLSDAESLKLNDENYITSIGQNVKNSSEIQGQYIGLMKFQNNGILQVKKFYKNAKKDSKDNPNPLNPKIPFRQSYMTDLLHGLIKNNFKLKAVMVKNGWLELDSVYDYELYQKLYSSNDLIKFIEIND